MKYINTYNKKITALLLVFILALSISGCSNQPPKIEPQEENNQADGGETYIFVDSCGREVELPKNVDKIAPSGSLAQIILYTLCPDKLVGLTSVFTEDQKVYVEDKHSSLPNFGSFYGDTLNLEAVLVAQPQVIFDIGQFMPKVKDDMDGIQDKTGIPTVFIEMEMDSTVEAYKTLGKILGEEERAEQLVDYFEELMSTTSSKLKEIPEEERKSVYYAQDEGLTAIVSGAIHGDTIEYAGGINVVELEETLHGGVTEVSIEHLLLWNPDVILFAPNSIYDDVLKKSEWEQIPAIKENSFYEIPIGPYNWIGRPPSVNRFIGIKWLSNLLYPEVFDYDMVDETQKFYKLFYHYDITEEQVKDLLTNSTFK